MGKHKKHKKHHSHSHDLGFKDLSAEMKVVVPLQSLFEEATPQFTVSIPLTLLHPPHSSHHPHAIHQPHSLHTTHQAHPSHHHSPHQIPNLPTHSPSEHKHHHKKHKKKHKKHHHQEVRELQIDPKPQKVAPLRLPVPKSDPPQVSHASHTMDPTHTHAHTKHHKHKHKRSRESMEEHHITPSSDTQATGSIQDITVPSIKRPKLTGLELTKEQSAEAEKRLVTPLHLQLPPEMTHEGQKHKKKKKKHKHSKTSGDEGWEVVKETAKLNSPIKPTAQQVPPRPSPMKTPISMTSEPKATPTIIDHSPAHTSPGKQMQLLRGLKTSHKEKPKDKKQPVAGKEKPVEVRVQTLTPPLPIAPTKAKVPQVKLSENALKFFLKNLHHLIQKRDPEGVFSEPVTDDIAPNYSSIISHPMDLSTIASKIEANQYPSYNEFKADFELMCSNAMIYNAPETAYYSLAKHLLNSGLQIIAKETSLRPDILHGQLSLALDRGQSASPLPPSVKAFQIPSSTNVVLDNTSPFLCRVPLSLLTGTSDENIIDVSGLNEIKDQSHLTKVVVGVESEDMEPVSSLKDVEEADEELLEQVLDAADTVKENLDISCPGSKFCFVNRDEEGKTMLNILDPETSTVDYSKPIDLTYLSSKVRMGNNAATVLKTELPMMKATPVSYLMYGPFGSFAPAYDSAFASLAKFDSDQLLSTYGNELGVSYAHSLQQFVKGTGSFVSEMADAVLNGLTNNRHSKFMEKMKQASASKESKPAEDKPTDTKDSHNESEKGLSEAKSDNNCKTTSLMKIDNSSDSDQKPKSTSPQIKTEIKESSEDTLAQDMPKDVIQTPKDDNSITPVPNKDTKQPFSVEDMELENTPQGVETQLSQLSESRQDSRASTPVSIGNSGSVRDVASIHSSKVASEADSNSSVSEGSSEGSRASSVSRAIDQDEDSRDSHVSTGGTHNVSTVDAQLQHTSDLLAELQGQQNIRLSLPTQESSSGHILLPGPSQAELHTAAQVRSQLASLTAQTQPRDVVSVNSLHEAMGISVQNVMEEESVAPASSDSVNMQDH